MQSQESEQSLFGLSIDPQSKVYLTETAKWGKFLSVLGFILCTFMLLGGIIFATMSNDLERSMNRDGFSSREFRGLGATMAITYIVIAVLYFFPCLYLLRFSSYVQAAINSGEQEKLTTAFMSLKSLFRFVGICTLIVVGLAILGAVIVSVTGNGTY